MLKHFDQECNDCHKVSEVLCEPFTTVPCPVCGSANTERVWRSIRVIGDDIPGGLVVENLGPEPVKVYSKSELKREAEKRGLVQRVRHVEGSTQTSRWI